MTLNNKQNRLYTTLGRNTTLLVTSIMMVILGIYGVLPVFAVLTDQDPFYSCGSFNWGIKTFDTASGSSHLFGRNTGCSAVAGPIPGTFSNGSPDTRTNYVELKTILNSAQLPNQAWESSIQGCDPFGNYDGGSAPAGCTLSGGASVHTSYSISGSDTNLALQTQFVWLRNSTNVPNDPNAYSNLLTDFWLTPTSGSRDRLVLDFASANLVASAGNWALKPETVGLPYSGNVVTGTTTTNCIYHHSVVIDNTSAANTWRETPVYSSISSDIGTATGGSYTQVNGSNCPTTLPSGETLNSQWNIVDIESGVEVGTSSASYTGTVGTETGAFSKTSLTY